MRDQKIKNWKGANSLVYLGELTAAESYIRLYGSAKVSVLFLLSKVHSAV